MMTDDYLHITKKCFFNNLSYANYYNKLLVGRNMNQQTFQKMIDAELSGYPQFFHIKNSSLYEHQIIDELIRYISILNSNKSTIIECLKEKYGIFAQIFLSRFTVKNNQIFAEFQDWINQKTQEGYLQRFHFSSLMPFIFLDIQINDSILSIGLNNPQISDIISNTLKDGFIIINENDTKLAKNNYKIDSKNCCVISYPIDMIPNIQLFDKVLCVSPSINDGFFDYQQDSTWPIEKTVENHIKQKKYLISALDHLKTGGVCVYATHSINPFENEAVINSVLKMEQFKGKLELVDCHSLFQEIERNKGLTSWDLDIISEYIFSDDLKESLSCNSLINNLDYCMRFYSHQIHCNGTFVAVIKKADQIETLLDKQCIENECSSKYSQFKKVGDDIILKIIDSFGLPNECISIPFIYHESFSNNYIYYVTNNLMNAIDMKKLKICNIGALAFKIDKKFNDMPFIPSVSTLPEIANHPSKRFIIINIREFELLIESKQILISKLTEKNQAYLKSNKPGGIYIFLEEYGPVFGGIFNDQILEIAEKKNSFENIFNTIKQFVSFNSLKKQIKLISENEQSNSIEIKKLQNQINDNKIDQGKEIISLRQEINNFKQNQELKNNDNKSKLDQQKLISDLQETLKNQQYLINELTEQQNIFNQKLTKDQQSIDEIQKKQNRYEYDFNDLNDLKEKYRKIIKVLYVYSRDHQSINLNFIEELNNDQVNKKYFIHYLSINDIEYQIKLQTDKDYMNKFDIVVLGGCDSYSYYIKGVNQDTFNSIKRYHNRNGIVLLLHDVMYGPLKDIFLPLTELIGFERINPLTGSSLHMFKQVKLNNSISETDIQSIVFPIGNTFAVAETHYTPKYDQKYIIFSDPKNNENYYTENLDEHLADCQMGHTIQITKQEQEFFYNVICHLFEHCKNHNVKTLI